MNDKDEVLEHINTLFQWFVMLCELESDSSDDVAKKVRKGIDAIARIKGVDRLKDFCERVVVLLMLLVGTLVDDRQTPDDEIVH